MLYHFDYSPLGKQRIDIENGIVYGVTVITEGKEARGHDLITDRKTLEQMFESSHNHGDKIPTKLDHKSGISQVNGFLTNFRIQGPKLKADWHLLKTQSGFGHTLELCQTMSDIVGLSASFTGEGEQTTQGKMARCTDLISVDFVTSPAVNVGLFESNFMNEENQTELSHEETTDLLHEALAHIDALTEHINNLEDLLSHLIAEHDDCDDDEEPVISERGAHAGPHDYSLEEPQHQLSSLDLANNNFDFHSAVSQNRASGMSDKNAHIAALKSFAAKTYNCTNLGH